MKLITTDYIGKLVLDKGFVYHLTQCCETVALDSQCPQCKNDVSEDYDIAWLPNDKKAWNAYANRIKKLTGEDIKTKVKELQIDSETL